jgi:hypothetical protein
LQSALTAEDAMDPIFAHPLWIVAGILLILVGLWLFRWGRQNDASAEIAAATAEAAFEKFRKKSPTKDAQKSAFAAKPKAKVYFRNSMAQFFGIVGVLMTIAGIVAIVFGIFYGAEG